MYILITRFIGRPGDYDYSMDYRAEQVLKAKFIPMSVPYTTLVHVVGASTVS